MTLLSEMTPEEVNAEIAECLGYFYALTPLSLIYDPDDTRIVIELC